MGIRKIAAQAALLQFLFLAVMMGAYSYVMNGTGMTMDDWYNPTKTAQFTLDHKSTFTLLWGLDWFFAITVFVLAAAFTQKFSRQQPWLGIVIGGFGVISSGLFLTAGTIGIYGVKLAVADYASGAGLGFMKSMTLMQSTVEMSAVAAIGVVTFATALASTRTKGFAAWVNWLGFISGFFAVASFALSVISPSLQFLGMIGMTTSILFNLGVALEFMRKPQPELHFPAQMQKL